MKKHCLIYLLLPLMLAGCLYKMPNDETISTLPHTNNPHLTREQPIQYMPTS
ncbi:MAG: hypothetical protein SP4CHLAM17_14330 [Chlamydiales bacterium]|nr:hypothetical protein [Chlamydiales bacterium]